jgi:hypothetical protein
VPAAKPDRHHLPELRVVNGASEQVGSWRHQPLHDRPYPWPPGLVYASLELSPAGSERCFAFQAEQHRVYVVCVGRRPTPRLERDRSADLCVDRHGAVSVLAPVRGRIRQGMRCEQSLRFVVREPWSVALLPIQTGADQLAGARWIEIPVAGRVPRGRNSQARRSAARARTSAQDSGSGSLARAGCHRWAVHPRR